MSRIGKVERRLVAPDPLYQNPLVAKLINKVMKNGKKSLAQKIVYEAFKMIKQKGIDPITTFERAVENVTPKMEVRPRRVGGASYLVPLEVRGARRQILALSWLVAAAASRTPKELVTWPKNQKLASLKIASEILDAEGGSGKAVAKKQEMHRIAEANKAFAHFRW